MRILSIETSCDETGISILEVKGNKKNPSFKVLANSLNSQIKIHAPYGGVFPALAKREHQKNLPILLERTLKKAHLRQGFGGQAKSPIDLIAVTSGPGLEPALWTGIVFAKELSKKWDIPLVPVNHMEGHILSVFGKYKEKFKIPLLRQGYAGQAKNKFPILALLVSGGHTELVLINNFGKYKIIGETLDDAAGEAFDKVARMLGLPYPGGPEISKLAEGLRRNVAYGSLGRSVDDGQRKFSAENFRADRGNVSSKTLPKSFLQVLGSPRQILLEARPDHSGNLLGSTFSLPRPMLHSKNFDFSFSGLKTAVLYLVRDLKKEHSNILQNVRIKQMIAKEFEDAVVETLVYKTKKAIEKYNIKTVIVAGGVSSNKYLRVEMKKLTKNKQNLFFPEKKLATDNSVMIGIVGYLKFLGRGEKGVNPSKIKAEGGLRL